MASRNASRPEGTARKATLEPERGLEPTNLPITNRLRYHCATRADHPW